MKLFLYWDAKSVITYSSYTRLTHLGFADSHFDAAVLKPHKKFINIV